MIFDIMICLLSIISWPCGNLALEKPEKVPETIERLSGGLPGKEMRQSVLAAFFIAGSPFDRLVPRKPRPAYGGIGGGKGHN